MADQAPRPIGVTSPLGDNVLLLSRMSGNEELGRLFRYDLELLSEKGDLKLDDILGQLMTVRLEYDEDKQRFFNGHVAEFRQLGASGRYYRYQAVLRPWLWFLTRTSDCRIFPDKKKAKTAPVPDIIKEVFREHGFTDFEDALQGEYKPWEHCVQYRETDFNFVSRMMEQEGIYYFFKHEDGKHILVLCDDYNSHEATEGYDTIPYFPPGGSDARERDHIWEWNFGRVIQPGLYAVNDFDFMRPTASLEFKSQIAREHTQAEYEMYDYPGEFVEAADGEKSDKDGNDDIKAAYEKTAKMRIEELHSQFEVCRGVSNARGLTTGALFSLDGYMREDQDREYLIVSANYELKGDVFGTEGSDAGEVYICTIGAIDAKQPFRSARITPKPMIQGPQTAIVTGQSGETVYTDQYGRAKVQFHWDRYGQNNEESSCWVRVSQNWAGPNWGGMFLPHIGQEVIVEFLEGDPDRPIITGRVYNEDNMPPLKLPDQKYISIVRDHYGNQIMMDGTPDDESLTLFSPSQGSALVLGKSLKKITQSSEFSATYGDTDSFHFGNKSSTVAGSSTSTVKGSSYSFKTGTSVALENTTSFSAFLGVKGSVMVGGEFSFTLGWKYSFGLAREFKYTKGDYKRTAKEDIILDSAKNVVLCGGADDNTMLRSNNSTISMSFGKAKGGRDMSAIDKGTKWATALSAAALAIPAVVEGASHWGLGKAIAGRPKKQEGTGENKKIYIEEDEKDIRDAAGRHSGIMESNWIGLLATMAAVKGSSVDSPSHESVTSQIILEDGKLYIWAGAPDSNDVLITMVGDKKKLIIESQGEVEIYGKNKISLISDTEIVLDAPTLTPKGGWKGTGNEVQAKGSAGGKSGKAPDPPKAKE
jgi:type VI secretion system secreted protein VgrG